MKRVRSKETTIENNPQIVTRSRFKKRDEEGDENYSLSIPQDLIIEILVRLPPKSLAKLILVSKLWCSIIREKHFTDLFLTRSLTHPCFLIAFRCGEIRLFHTASHEVPSSLHQNSTTRTTLNQDYRISQPIRGLICAQNASKMVICNPSTGQVVALPNVKTRRKGISTFLGYDSVKDEYKVLCMTVLNVSEVHEPVVSEEHQVFTLGGQKKKWRMIDCQHPHCPATKGLFMNGIFYYGAWSNSLQGKSLMVGFDVRLEEFSLVQLPEDVKIRSHGRSELVDYLGKIALVDQSLCGQLHMWVLEDVEKQEWSKIFVVVPSWENLVRHNVFRCVGTISTGELIFAPNSPHYPHPFFIVYYDLRKDRARRVEIEGIRDFFTADMIVFLNHVENPMVL